MPAKKVAAKKKAAKKPAKKTAVKAVKSAKPKAKVTKKKSAKKVTQKETTLKPVKVAGAANVRLVDDPGEATEGESVAVTPTLDKETGVITMVPVQ